MSDRCPFVHFLVHPNLSGPWTTWDITETRTDLLAATLPYKHKVQFVSVTGSKLATGRQLEVSGYCHGMAYNQGRLIISYCRPAYIEILSMDGDVLHSFRDDNNGQPLFEWPHHITLSPDKTLIYVSDYEKHSVTCMTADGEVVATYKDQQLERPQGLVCDMDGAVCVCCWSNGTLHVLSPRCGRGRVLTQTGASPRGVAFCTTDHKLFVGHYQSNTIQVCKIT